MDKEEGLNTNKTHSGRYVKHLKAIKL